MVKTNSFHLIPNLYVGKSFFNQVVKILNEITAPQFLNYAIVLFFNWKQRLQGSDFLSYMIHCSMYNVRCTQGVSQFQGILCNSNSNHQVVSPEDHSLENMYFFCSSRASSISNSSLLVWLDFKTFVGGDLRVTSSTQVLCCRHAFSLHLSACSNFNHHQVSMVTTGISVYFLAHFEARGALSFLLEILCSLLRNLKQE